MADVDESSLIEAWEEYNEKASDEAENRLLAEAWKVYEEELASRNNEDYEVDEEQMRKFSEAYTFFQTLVKENEGHMEPMKIEPKECHAGITAYFDFIYMNKEQLAQFKEIIGNIDSLSIGQMDNEEFCISFNIPNVYRKKRFKLVPH